jgi:bifunctional DNA-binding transcriptional regulator/antitoxin component of YhaV-PrlF toxin-antitoxin module
MRRLLGSTRVSTDNKITIVKEAAWVLDIKKGDIVAFYEEDGRIFVAKG